MRFLEANDLPAIPYPGFAVVNLWLNSPRANFVDNNPDDDQPDPTTGCTTCFLYYLHDQLGFSIKAIIAAGASTLAGVYKNLTGRTDAWQAFSALVNLHYPPGVIYNPAGDDLFPVPVLTSFTGAQIQSDSDQTLRLLSLAEPALAEVTVALASDKPSALGIPTSITIPTGGIAPGIELRAAPIVGPTVTVNIQATYAGKTLTSAVEILPRPSFINGRVTDEGGRPIIDAEVVLHSDSVTLPGGGSSLELATNSHGTYKSPFIPPGVYEVSVLQSGFVPAEASVTVPLGVPVTSQSFVLVRTKPFTISGKVTDTHGAPIGGATVTLVKDSPVPGILKVTTEANGLYSVTMDPGPYNGDYSIDAVAAGFLESAVTIAAIPNGAAITQNFVLKQTHPFTITGRVVDANGPIGLANIIVESVNQETGVGAIPPNQNYSALTDAAGNYLISVNPGAYTGGYAVSAGARGFRGAMVTDVEQPSAASVTVNFSLVPLPTGGGGGHHGGGGGGHTRQ